MVFFAQFKSKNCIISIVASGLLLVALVITILSVLGSIGGKFYFDLLSHFQVQYLLSSLLLAGLLGLLRRKKLFLIALICVGINLREVIPWYLPHLSQVGQPYSQMRILVSNVWSFKNKDREKLSELVRKEKPAIAAFVEFNNQWVKQFESLKDILPYSTIGTDGWSRRIVIYSQQPMENVNIKYFAKNRPMILADVNLNGQKVSLIAAHAKTPLNQKNFDLRNQQLEGMGAYIKTVKNPLVMMGDLNITMWSKYYKKFERESGMKNARQGFGIQASWPSAVSIPGILFPFLSIPIDHCLTTPDIKVVNLRTGPIVGSDHLPLITDLQIPLKQRRE
jgi:endonuclease/exonuclease/phosphatase (EEP) superfamily protein YafD